MIARLWSAVTTPENWPAYEQHFIESVVPELRAIQGYVAANLLKRQVEDQVHLTVLTFWHSLEAIDVFTGEDREAAVVASHASALLISYDKRVQHFGLAFADTPFNLRYT
jgi:heme-degrading monooxygenase HmoA